MFNFWSKGRATEIAVKANNASTEESKVMRDRSDIHPIAHAIAELKGLDFTAVLSAVNKATVEQRRAWLMDTAIASEIARNRAEYAQALANLKIDAATMTVKGNEINHPSTVQRAHQTRVAVEAEVARIRSIRFEKERICEEEYSQAFEKLGKINESRADNLAKKHRREMAEERQRADAAIEAEVARIRAEKAAKPA